MLRLLHKIYNLYFSREKNLARRIYQLLGFVPTRLNLFKLAFYHKSSHNQNANSLRNNERLEFLGDAMLSAIVAEYLFLKYPESDEGFMTKMRSKIVKRDSLNKIGAKMGLDELLEHYNDTKISTSMLGNAFEALAGAIYFELGYKKGKKLIINKILRQYLDIHELETYDDNYKSQLLEWSQKNSKAIEFRTVSKYKLQKRDRFKIAVIVDGKKYGVADDFNKKSAEQNAAQSTLKILGITKERPSEPSSKPPTATGTRSRMKW